ncbi:MAG: NTP transferase domain-containing protein, partial [Alphaproteobacteria bacterium]
LYATARGLARVDGAALDRLNLVDEAVTVATLAPYAVVEPGQMVATVKIIPFAVPRAMLERCLAVAGSPAGAPPLVGVAPFRARDAGLVLTRLAGTKDKVLDGTGRAVKARLDALGCRLVHEVRCDHDAAAVAAAIRDAEAAGAAMVLVYGASAITDRRDVIPAAVEAAGGTIVHLGMPVDPGNLLLLARHGDVPVLGLPGCARSPRLNGFDWVLERLVADVAVTRADIMAMGAGGLLMEVAQRGLARAEASPARPVAVGPAAAGRPKVAAVVLAAGQSRRMGPVNKLLADLDGKPMVAHVVDAALASAARPVVVVTGHQEDAVRRALAGRAVTFVANPDHAGGLSTSLIHGIDALPADVTAAVVCLGDMPWIGAALIDRLIAAYDPTKRRAIVVPSHHGKRGNPVLWDRRFFPAMKRLAGDVGARHLIGEHEDQVAEIDSTGDAVLADIDTPQALADAGRAGRAAS